MDFRAFEATPGISVIMLPDAPVYTHVAVSNDFVQSTGLRREDVIGIGHFEVFPKSPDDSNSTGEQNLKASFEYILQHRKPHEIPLQRYDIPNGDGSFSQKYWKINNAPILNEAGDVLYIIHSALDITEQVQAAQKMEAVKGMENAYNLFMAAPVIIGILKGDDYIIELANENLLEIWGRTTNVIGKPLLKAIPELEAQGILQLLENVRITGEPFYAYAFPIKLVRHGKEEVLYFDFVYKPVYDDKTATKASSIISIGHDVTEQVRSRQRIKNVIEQASDPVLILMGEDLVLEEANQPLFELWQVSPDALNKPFLEILPEMKDQGFLELLKNVLHTGQPFYGYEQPAVFKRKNGTLETRFVNFSYNPYREPDGTITGVIVMASDVTEQVKAKQQLVESERNLRNTILQAPVAMCILRGKDLVVEVANARMFELWGKQSHHVLNRPIFEGIPEARHQGLEELLHQVYTTGDTYSANERPVDLPRNGRVETVYINFVYEPLREGDGSIAGIIAVAIDVTEQVKARQQVEQSEQYVRALVESAPFPIAAYEGQDMRIVLANKSILDIWGKGYNVVGKRYVDVLPELNNQEVFTQLQNVYASGLPFHARNQHLELIVDGTPKTFYFNYSFTPIKGLGGKVVGVMNTGADVTDLNVAKQQVEKSEQNFRNMILQAPVAMCILLGEDHVVDIANEAMIELWGKPREVVMHKPIFEGLPDARKQGLEQLLDNVYNVGTPFHGFEHPVELIRNGNTEIVYQNFVYEPYNDANGNRLGVLVISIDVTQQVLARQKIEEVVVQRTHELAQANASLIKSNEELKRSNAYLEEFAHAASHDLKEPIRKVLTFADRLKTSLNERMTESEKGYFERMENATRRMGMLVDDLLEYSYINERPLEMEQVDLEKKVRRVITDLELLVEEKKAVITIEKLPVIKGYNRQLQQLFQNLIGNALKYSKPGVPPEIKVAARKIKGMEAPVQVLPEQQGQYFHLVMVRDNGIGFEQHYAERIFGMFQRLHGKAEYAGTGVGLSIARKVTENHQGYIWAESEIGKGATFYVLLPAA